MPERAAGNGAETPKPTWYLARGDKRWGPLADRELLLLAERGGLKTDDLLWRPGFQSWKPVREVCDAGDRSRANPHARRASLITTRAQRQTPNRAQSLATKSHSVEEFWY
jgi:hypothetical protein